MISVCDAIADGLAENSYAVADQFLSQSEVTAILDAKEFQQGAAQFRKAGIGKQQQHQVNEAIRGDYIHWVDKNSAAPGVALYLDRVRDLMQRLNETNIKRKKNLVIYKVKMPVTRFICRLCS